MLLQTLARVECDRRRVGPIRVRGERGRREPERILRIRPRHEVGNDSQPVRVVDIVIDLGIERLVARATVISVPVHREVREIHVVIERASGPARIQARAKVIEAAVRHGAAQLPGNLAVGGEDLNHAA